MEEGSFAIRPSNAGDEAGIRRLYPAAFPDEDLLPLVGDLLRAAPAILSLVATSDSQVIGHVVFTRCRVTGGDEDDAALLGPLAVAPAHQQQGIGGALVREGIRRVQEAGAVRVFVLGDPVFYERFGFAPESGVAPPYPLPAEWTGAWQSKDLGRGSMPREGRLSVPEPWRRPALWAP